MITDDQVRLIISEPKLLKVDPNAVPFVKKRAQMEKEIGLECGNYDCSMVVRQSIDDPLNFSVILMYKDSNKNTNVVLRLNGNHGRHTNRLEKQTISGPHIHVLTERYQMESTHPDGYAEPTDLYRDLDGAIETFMMLANVKRSNQKERCRRRSNEISDRACPQVHMRWL